MPKKSRLENILFTLVMAFVMVYAMVCYNIAIDKGGMTNEVFLLAFHEIPIMWPIACILEYFVVEKLAMMLAFRLVNPKEDKPVFVTLAICSMIVSVSVLGLMNDTENHVQLVIDEDVLKGEYVGCHPCINTSSLRVRTADLMEKIIPAMHHEAKIIQI